MTHGVISAPQPEAVEAGAVMLQRGGNAVDAAMAAALASAMEMPPQLLALSPEKSITLRKPS